MKTPENAFKRALAAGTPQFGLWLGLADPYCAEIAAGAGFDWLLIDGEHAPNDLRSVLAQLQAIAAYPGSHPIVRPVIGDTAIIKQTLDLGAQTLLIPMVDTAEQAAALVAATRYPPDGVRGVGSALARASRWTRVPNYLDEADGEICLLVQVESVRGLENLDAIAAVPGVDGVFFGPSDLSASMGLRGQPNHPTVRAAIEDGMARVRRAGKAPGVLATDEAVARAYLAAGALFVGVGVDATLYARATSALAARFRDAPAPTPSTGGANTGGGY
ncbi:4-hydroxy-2-oxoheptanedioate aldolase [Azospirillum griseum]|uniref:4-hydroxy-2-oxoheptanedioate aldolase n=1 Tax=Azospirillum griseum TaxID=2496639 RepID=A0A3S0HWN8_9PROT|nr:4-hydroxy-2-oxoheptanedioate aldolase [Azospirillum griseum]RTR18950.1 4-hydroxy-2-oxoheptanedioate aldolase [Azospirillum griseum]